MKHMSKVCQLYNEGYSARKIGKIISRSYQSILNELHKNKIQIRYFQKGMLKKDFLIKEYIKNKKTTYQIASELGLSQSTILYWMTMHNIKRRSKNDYPSPTKGKKRPDLSERNKFNSGEKHPFYGKKRPEHSKRIKGRNHPNWKGGISPLTDKLRHKHWSDLEKWRKSIFERDNFICQKCGKRGGYLEADHIKSISRFPKLILDINNGQTLCKECHRERTNKSMKKYKRLNEKTIKRIMKKYKKDFETLENYDKTRELPFQRKRIDVTLSVSTINKLKKLREKTGQPISRIIEECVS